MIVIMMTFAVILPQWFNFSALSMDNRSYRFVSIWYCVLDFVDCYNYGGQNNEDHMKHARSVVVNNLEIEFGMISAVYLLIDIILIRFNGLFIQNARQLMINHESYLSYYKIFVLIVVVSDSRNYNG